MPSRAMLEIATPWCPKCRAQLAYDHDDTMWRCACGYETTIESLVHRQSSEVTVARPYKHYRADGWPYCPCCDEDELWSGETYATVETIVGCYRCGWTYEGYVRTLGENSADTGEEG